MLLVDDSRYWISGTDGHYVSDTYLHDPSSIWYREGLSSAMKGSDRRLIRQGLLSKCRPYGHELQGLFRDAQRRLDLY